jgi:hypothetical protein
MHSKPLDARVSPMSSAQGWSMYVPLGGVPKKPLVLSEKLDVQGDSLTAAKPA